MSFLFDQRASNVLRKGLGFDQELLFGLPSRMNATQCDFTQ